MKKNKKALCCLCSVLLVVGICLPNVPAIAAQGQTQTQTATAQNQTKTNVKTEQQTKDQAKGAKQADQKQPQSNEMQKSEVKPETKAQTADTDSKTTEEPSKTQEAPQTSKQTDSTETTPTQASGDISQRINATLSVQSNGQPTTPEEHQKVVVTPPTHEQVEKKITQETQSNQPKQAKSGTIETNEEPANQEQAQEPNAIPQTGDAVSISGTIILLLIVACAALIVASVIRNERK
jgi:hypothetical protein